ncbi:uncharacterized protein LOC116141019 [Pistacia vera]|uniref:uncharacterized protein LOC116141019 n=1 Tax=Pistacia vera TaxID=55513 RepID=UPI001262CDF2|nr:uncharacterized protein LOC116141019 [Pistacia vera]
MAADVTSSSSDSQTRRSSNSEILITKDLLGASPISNSESDLQNEQRVRCKSPNTPLSSIQHQKTPKTRGIILRKQTQMQISRLELPPCSHITTETNTSNQPFPGRNLPDLKLQSSNHYQSVCTLDKVKSALQRAEKKPGKEKTLFFSSPSPGPLNSSSLSGPGMFAAGCPGCLLYVITLKTNPRCPRCNATVPSPCAVKKAKIDLNSSF